MKNLFKQNNKKLDCFGLSALAMTWHPDNNCATSLRANAKQSSLLFFFLLLFTSPVFAYQDCFLTTDGKLTDISIENNKLVDVYPLITVMNEKNTLIVHPLSVGSTRFCVLKNNKNIVMFNIKISKNETCIDEVEGFDILPIDTPDSNYDDERFELDKPPINQY